MTNRDDLYRKFGPILFESLCLVLLDEINDLRTNQHMPPITQQHIIDKLTTHLKQLQPYDWMKEQEDFPP